MDREPVFFRDVPIHICEKAPKDRPYILNHTITQICPFCKEWLGTRDTLIFDKKEA